LIITSCSLQQSNNPEPQQATTPELQPTDTPEQKSHKVIMTVAFQLGQFDLTKTINGNTEQFSYMPGADQPKPITKYTYTLEDGDSVFISIKDTSGVSQKVSCAIFVDNKSWKQASSNGEYVTATCQGVIGSK
jgi:hypothetical protein